MSRQIAAYFALLLTVAIAVAPAHAAPADARTATGGIWADVGEQQKRAAASAADDDSVVPSHYRLLTLDREKFLAAVANAPHESTKALRPATGNAAATGVEIPLPMPDGSTARFRIVETSVMAPELAAKFPGSKTWAGQGIDDPTETLTLDVTGHGLHAMVLSPTRGRVFIDPNALGTAGLYMSYFTRDHRRSRELQFLELVNRASALQRQLAGKERQKAISAVRKSSGPQLRTYRLALAATSSYSTFWSAAARNPNNLSAVDATHAALLTVAARVDGIYRREIAVSLQLVANNDLLIFTAAGGNDPYGAGSLNATNQATIDRIIGPANYDIGHVVTQANGGGSAGLGVVCLAGEKAQGHTGDPSPVGDSFYVDYVAHEMGHQFGGDHTFNSSNGSCSGNREPLDAYEPGGGTSIMAYAGICSPDDVQQHSDPYFHTVSFDEIRTYLDDTRFGGGSCGVATATGNLAPVPNARLRTGFTIPARTPFALTGAAPDPNNGDVVTYSWEEIDLDAAGSPGDPARAPFFRVWPPTTNPTRTFPRLSDLLNKRTAVGETLPNVTRTLNFRLVARDNRADGGGVAYDTLSFNVTAAAGPFTVTAPLAGANWVVGSAQQITWNVASTNLAPVNCANVDISLSTDGGNTFATTLASTVPNNGAYPITVPNTPSFSARVKVACSDNVFFNISDAIQIGANQLTADGFEGAGWASAVVGSTGAAWTFIAKGTHPAAAPHGGTKLAQFNSYTASSGRQARLYQTASTALPANANSIILSFWMYHDTEQYSGPNIGQETLQPQVSTDGGVTWQNVGTLLYRNDGSTGWAVNSVDLTGFKGQSIRLGFLGTSGYNNDMYLDDITLTTLQAAGASVPGAPTIGAATAGNASATVNFGAPASNGGATIDNYRVTCTGNVTAIGAASPLTVSGLSNGTSTTCTVAAHNSAGWGPESAASNAVTPSAATAPGAPVIGTATPGSALLDIAFAAPASTGTHVNGTTATITRYNVACSPTGAGSGSASPVTVTGLVNGTSYTCTVSATNSAGLTGPLSQASAAATPTAFAGPAVLNIDDSDAPDVYSAATDGVILLRYLFGVRGTALIAGINATNPKRAPAQIETYIQSNLAKFNVDGDASTLALTDGLLILRRLLGLDGQALIAGARNSARSAIDIRNAIDALKP